jgi:RNA polymerase sigma factor (sigma-70 family)
MPIGGSSGFATTRWSVVLAAGRRSSPAAAGALAELCQRYWVPLYVYVRRRVGNVEAARDLTQEFFTRVLEKNALARADRARGKFRSFLLTSLQHFLDNEWHKARARKRGGGRMALTLDFAAKDSQLKWEPAHGWTAERLFERQWAVTLLERVLAQLRADYSAAGKEVLFDGLKGTLAGEAKQSIAAVADRLGMTAGAVKVAAHRLRRRYREMLRAEVAETLAEGEDVDQEIRSLLAALGNSQKNV